MDSFGRSLWMRPGYRWTRMIEERVSRGARTRPRLWVRHKATTRDRPVLAGAVVARMKNGHSLISSPPMLHLPSALCCAEQEHRASQLGYLGTTIDILESRLMVSLAHEACRNRRILIAFYLLDTERWARSTEGIAQTMIHQAAGATAATAAAARAL